MDTAFKRWQRSGDETHETSAGIISVAWETPDGSALRRVLVSVSNARAEISASVGTSCLNGGIIDQARWLVMVEKRGLFVTGKKGILELLFPFGADGYEENVDIH